MGMLEARIRILTNNTQKPVFSPQQVVSCSQYSQGKDAGVYKDTFQVIIMLEKETSLKVSIPSPSHTSYFFHKVFGRLYFSIL